MMLRSICEKIINVFRPDSRRKAPRRVRPRRLTVESLESRKLLSAATLTSNAISDGNFAAPALVANAFQIAPPSSPWQFTGDAGVSTNKSGFTVGNSNAPSGTQVAFLKNNASISQSVYLDAGVYNLTFLAAQRVNYQTQNQEVEVLVDGAEIGLLVPPSTTYSTCQTCNFSVAAGEHTVEFLGMSPQSSDSTAFIDEVTISPVVDTILDGGFEQPALTANTMDTDPGGLPWQFAGTAGVASNGNSAEPQAAPEGTQAGFVQNTGSMSQTVYLDAGSYQLSFLACQGTTDQTNYEEIEVLVDGTPYGTIEPAGTSYASCQSSVFSVTAGAHTIELLGVDPQGSGGAAFIDEASIAPANIISDASFETPALNVATYQFWPTGSSWEFSGGGGIASNQSAYTAGNANAPDGSQVAILEGNGSMSQSVALAAGSYNISFQAAQCSTNTAKQSQQVEVLVDGSEVGLITPSGEGYETYETSNFAVTPTQAALPVTIEFMGTNPQGGNNTALIDLVSLAASSDTITDGGFETPVLAANSYKVVPGGSPWQFAGLAGVSANGSSIAASGNAPQGSQAAFIMNGGSMSYSVYLDADTYSLSFLAAQRATNNNQTQKLQVLVDGVSIDSIAPSGTSYSLYQTATFTVAAGMHTIEFLGTNPLNGQCTALIDSVSIATAENTFADGGFESPVLAAKTYQIAPGGSGWQCSGIAGVTNNGSGFTNVSKGTLKAPDGAQVAFVKNNGSISQTVYFDAGTYDISFLASQRIGYQPEQIEVLVGSQVVGLITPSVSTTSNSTASNTTYTYTPCQTSNFTISTSGAYLVKFQGMNPASGDSTAFLDDATITAGSAIDDGSFETLVLAAKSYQVAPSSFGWQFTGLAGVSTNNSGFTAGNAGAPVGNQVAFIKQTATMSQLVDMAAGTYNISFLAAQRSKYQASYESIEILVDGEEIGTATPSGTNYGSYSTNNFTVTAGPHTIEFLGVDPSGSDNTAFIDDVQLNA